MTRNQNFGGAHFIADADTPSQQMKVNPDGSINVSGSISASLGAFNTKAVTTLAVSGVSSRVALPSADIGCVLRNIGTVDAYFAFGDGTVAATTSSFLIKAGDVFGLDVSGYTYIAGITASSSTTFEIWTGTGLVATSQAGSSGGGGAVTIADGANVTQGAVADAAYTSGSGTLVAILKGVFAKLGSILTALGSPMQTTGGTLAATNFPTTVDVNSGNKSNSTLRFVIATDQPQLTNAMKVDGSGVTQPVSGSVTVSGTVTANPSTSTPVLVNGLTNSATSVVSSVAATLKSYYCYNPNSSVAYVQIFDVATAGGVTVGTTTPKWSIGIPPTSAANLSGLNMSFANGIQVAATTAATNGTAPSTALDCNFGYT